MIDTNKLRYQGLAIAEGGVDDWTCVLPDGEVVFGLDPDQITKAVQRWARRDVKRNGGPAYLRLEWRGVSQLGTPFTADNTMTTEGK